MTISLSPLLYLLCGIYSEHSHQSTNGDQCLLCANLHNHTCCCILVFLDNVYSVQTYTLNLTVVHSVNRHIWSNKKMLRYQLLGQWPKKGLCNSYSINIVHRTCIYKKTFGIYFFSCWLNPDNIKCKIVNFIFNNITIIILFHYLALLDTYSYMIPYMYIRIFILCYNIVHGKLCNIINHTILDIFSKALLIMKLIIIIYSYLRIVKSTFRVLYYILYYILQLQQSKGKNLFNRFIIIKANI